MARPWDNGLAVYAAREAAEEHVNSRTLFFEEGLAFGVAAEGKERTGAMVLELIEPGTCPYDQGCQSAVVSSRPQRPHLTHVRPFLVTRIVCAISEIGTGSEKQSMKAVCSYWGVHASSLASWEVPETRGSDGAVKVTPP